MPLPEKLSTPDAGAALSGVFRLDGCTRGYAAHATRCPRCQDLLAKGQQNGELPAGWASVIDARHRPATVEKQPHLPDVSVTRNFVGRYRVELPMLPYEFARRLEQLEKSEPWVVLRRELSIALGEETRLEASHMRPPVLTLDEVGRAALIKTLIAQREPELEYEPWSTTLVFKSLAG
jgi:hypothetical protein